MKKKHFIVILFVALFTVPVWAQTMNDGSRYAQNSVLKSGRWFKLAVEKSGIYKLTYEYLSSIGISNPANIRVFGYGGALLPEHFTNPYIDDLPEVAIYMNKGTDGVFNAGDYILFYAQGVVSWSYGNPPNASEPMFYHTLNYYSTKGYYFLTCDNIGVGKRISLKEEETTTPTSDIVDFTHYDLHEVDKVNLANSGREFYGEEFNASALKQIYTFNTPNMLPLDERMRVKIANAGNAANFTVELNNKFLKTLAIAGAPSGSAATDYRSPINITSTTSSPIITAEQSVVKIECLLSSVVANLDFVELNVRRKLIIVGNEFYFRNKPVSQNQCRRFVLTNANANTEIWDITDQQNIKQISTTLSGDTLKFVANINSVREYLAIKPSNGAGFIVPQTTDVSSVANQNLHSLPQTDYVIIAHNDFLGEAERLAQVHRVKNGLDVHVVDASKIFNEFSSGTPDATAYRRFVKMFYDRAYSSQNENAQFPKYLLLFGDGSFDNRNLLNNPNPLVLRLLTFQSGNSLSGTESYVADDYFGYMDDNTGTTITTNNIMVHPSQRMTVGVGRFPVYSLEQAKTVVDKTIRYMDNDLRGSWKNQVLYIADDGNDAGHAQDIDVVSDTTANKDPEFLVRKLYLDAYKQVTTAAGESYPDVERQLDNYIKQGVLVINYMGHGGSNGVTKEKILTQQKIDKMYHDKLPFYITATCDFTGFDQFYETAGEKIIWNKNGGAVALFTTTRTVNMLSNATLNRYFATNIFTKDEDCNPLALGDILRLSKNSQNSYNKFSFMLVGDPALKLVYPHEVKVITDSINFKPINSLAFDTISALGTVLVSGHVENCYGDKIHGFNGFVTVHVFDKEETITTLANSGSGSDEHNIHFSYKDRPNALFNGSAKVENGKFQFAFVVPKDIKYNFGTGRIVYYTSEDNLGMEGNGYFENFIIGGETNDVAIDTEGPLVKLYMNLPEFKNGGIVNPSPLFVAEVFDENGINTIGSGLGHDMIMRINGTNKNGKPVEKYNNEEIVLNSYYKSELGSYQRGKVEYQLTDLEIGNYMIKFRVWDMFNNSTNAELRFVVSEDSKINADVDIYPNPATVGETITFSISHDRPDQLLNIGISVYDLVGRVVWRTSKNKEYITSGTKTEIQFNPSAEGCLFGAGVYIIRLELSTQNEKSAVIPLKLIVKTQ